MERGCHVLILPYPTQGHINPMMQLAKRLVSKGVKATLVLTTNFVSNTDQLPTSSHTVALDTISDGYDEGGFAEAPSIDAYLEAFQTVGSRTLSQLIQKYETISGELETENCTRNRYHHRHPISCIIYDPFLMWALDVAKQHGLLGAAFFTQPCGVNYIYYQVHHGLLTLPVSSSESVSIPGMPLLQLHDMPSFIHVAGSYPAYFEMVLNQFSNLDKADFVLVNTFYELESEVVDEMKKVMKVLTIGPTIPSSYIDGRVENDKEYSLNLYPLDPRFREDDWLSCKPSGSVVYVAFGSLAILDEKQMGEIAWGLKASDCSFLWVVRSSEEAKLPKGFPQEVSGKGLIVRWSPQLEVLSSKAVGCFFTHGGWNSTTEALSLGVPMVVMPQWTDQTTNAKFVQDVWKVGIRVKVDDEKGVVTRQEIESCINQVMIGDKGKEMKRNALKWKKLAKDALCEGGTSDSNIEALISELTKSR